MDALKEREANKGKPRAKQKASAGSLKPKNRAAISRVLLIGGATRMPSFQKFAENMTGMKPDLLLADPDLVSQAFLGIALFWTAFLFPFFALLQRKPSFSLSALFEFQCQNILLPKRQ